jgi:hypothetical protein
VSFGALAELLEEAGAAGIYLNVSGLGNAGSAPAQMLGPVVPLVIWRRISSRDSHATSQAVAWLRHWLQTRADPVAALHKVTAQAERSETAEAAMVLVHTRYRAWQTEASINKPPSRDTYPT